MKEFHPTWLYIKTHNKTGLNYLGKTGRKKSVDPFKYEGSGTYWMRHLKKHGKNFSTFIIGYYTDEFECLRMAVFYSWFFDVVKSNDWANLKYETLDGGGGPQSEEARQKNREAALARVEKGLNPFSKRPDGTSISSDRVEAGTFENQFLKRPDGTSISSDRVGAGTHHLLKREDGTSIAQDAILARIEARTFVSPGLKREDGSSVAADRSAARTHNWQSHNQVKKECPHCHQWFFPCHYARYHGEKCKMNLIDSSETLS